MPIGSATIQVRRIVKSEMTNVSSRRSPRISLTDWLRSIERPRLPCSRPVSADSKEVNHMKPIQRAYCFHAGSSK